MVTKKTITTIVILLIGIFLLYHFTGTSDELNEVSEPHFTKKDISYNIEINSSIEYENKTYKANDTYKEREVEKALRIVEESSRNNINFYEIDSSRKADIKIIGKNAYNNDCDNFLAWERELDYVTNGWGTIVEYNEERQIFHSEIIFCSHFKYNYSKEEYYATWGERDDFPETEVHEILHTLGFDHKNETCHIMNPYSQSKDCNNLTINNDISGCLNKIYSNNKEGFCSFTNFMI